MQQGLSNALLAVTMTAVLDAQSDWLTVLDNTRQLEIASMRTICQQKEYASTYKLTPACQSVCAVTQQPCSGLHQLAQMASASKAGAAEMYDTD